MSSLIGAFLFLVLIVIVLMIYIYIAVVVVRYTLFFFRYLKPAVRNTIIIMFFLVTLWKQTILTAVGIVWFVLWTVYILFKNRKSPKGWLIIKLNDIVIPPKEIFVVGTKRSIALLFVGLLLINSAYWIKERYEWVNDKHAYKDAKEYYAVGNVLLFYRALLAIPLSPENNLLQPLEWLQRAIIQKGVSLIPKDDAEWAMWEYRFFWYLYIRNMHIPSEAPNPLGIIVTIVVPLKSWAPQMWDKIYKGLDDLANKPMKDTVFKEEKYLAYPPLALYFNEGFTGVYYSINRDEHGSLYNFVKDKEGIKPLENIVRWLEKTQSEWRDHPKILKTIKSKPRIEIAQQAALILYLSDILNNKMYQGTFRCDDPWFLKIYPYSKAFNAPDGPLTKVPKEERFIYMVANRQISMASYAGYKLCGYERLKGDDDSWTISAYRDLPLDGNIKYFHQLYYYAKRGIEQQNKLKQTQGE